MNADVKGVKKISREFISKIKQCPDPVAALEIEKGFLRYCDINYPQNKVEPAYVEEMKRKYNFPAGISTAKVIVSGNGYEGPDDDDFDVTY